MRLDHLLSMEKVGEAQAEPVKSVTMTEAHGRSECESVCCSIFSDFCEVEKETAGITGRGNEAVRPKPLGV